MGPGDKTSSDSHIRTPSSLSTVRRPREFAAKRCRGIKRGRAALMGSRPRNNDVISDSEEKIALGEGQDPSRFAGEYFPVGFDDVGLRVDLYLR